MKNDMEKIFEKLKEIKSQLIVIANGEEIFGTEIWKEIDKIQEILIDLEPTIDCGGHIWDEDDDTACGVCIACTNYIDGMNSGGV